MNPFQQTTINPIVPQVFEDRYHFSLGNQSCLAGFEVTLLDDHPEQLSAERFPSAKRCAIR
jgi:hypothetical protein